MKLFITLLIIWPDRYYRKRFSLYGQQLTEFFAASDSYHRRCFFLFNKHFQTHRWQEKPKDLLLITGSLGSGGSERQVTLTLCGLARRGEHNAKLICTYLRTPAEGFYLPQIEATGIKVHRINGDDSKDNIAAFKATEQLPGSLWQVKEYIRTINQHSPKAVHLWLDEVNIKAGIAAVAAGAPRIVLGLRSMPPIYFPFYKAYMREGYRWLVKQPGVILVNNSAAGARAYEKWLGLPAGYIHVVHNGFDFANQKLLKYKKDSSNYRKKHNIPENSQVIGSVMRLGKEKRPLLWLKAAALIHKQMPNVHFLIVGDGPLRKDLEAFIEKMKMKEVVHMVGVETDVFTAVASMDLFLLTSYVEGLPNVLIEAQALGIPVVVATEAGGANEAFEHDKTGWLLENNDPQYIANTIIKLITDKEWMQRAKDNAPSFVKNKFDLDIMIAKTDYLYRSELAYNGTLLDDAYFKNCLTSFEPALAQIPVDKAKRSGLTLMIGTLGPGGAENQIYLTLKGLSARGYNPSLICIYLDSMNGRAKFYLPKIKAAGIEVEGFNWDNSHDDELECAEILKIADQLPIHLREVKDYIRTLSSHHPEVIHLWMDDTNIKAGIAAVVTGVPRIILELCALPPYFYEHYQPYMREGYRWLAKQPGVTFVAVSKPAAQAYEKWLGFSEGHIHVMNNGFEFNKEAINESIRNRKDYRSRHNIPQDVNVIGSVFGFRPEKRPMLWLEIATLVHKLQPSTHFLLVGDGNMRSELEEKINQEGLKEFIHLVGIQQNPLSAMAAMDIFLLTSHAEGFANVIAEAQSIGLPVVSTDSGGPRDALDNGQTGWILENDDPAYIADFLVKLLNNDIWLAAARAKAPKFVQRFELEHMIDKSLALYGDSISKQPSLRA